MEASPANSPKYMAVAYLLLRVTLGVNTARVGLLVCDQATNTHGSDHMTFSACGS